MFRPGFYRVLTRKKNHIVLIEEDENEYQKAWPDVDHLLCIPDDNQEPISVTLPNSDYGVSRAIAKINRATPSFWFINPAFLKDIDDAGDIYINKETASIFFETNQKKASIGFIVDDEG